jgi:proteasome-associated ATPase
LIDELMSPPFKIGTFVQPISGGNTALVIVDGNFAEVSTAAVSYRSKAALDMGDAIRITEEGNAESKVFGLSLRMGAIATVKDTGPGWCEVDAPEGVRRVMTELDFETEAGSRIVLDASGFLAVEDLGKTDNNYLREATKISWDDIGGLYSAKEQMIEAVEQPMLHPEIYEAYSQEPIKGVLLYGPPGCGKTLLGKAAATSIAASHGAEASTGFIYVKGPEVLSKWVGESEAKIRQLFAMARDHKAETGYPAVIFIDEADALLGRRGRGVSSSVQGTIVPSFLAEMDGLDDTGALVLLATNMPNTLDPAVVRPGRIDRKIKISRPDRDSAKEILEIHLKNKPLYDLDTSSAVDVVLDLVFSPVTTIQDGPMAEVLNGAMLEGIVSRAISLAIKADIKDASEVEWDDVLRRKRGKGVRPSAKGIRREHLEDAVNLVSLQDEDVDVSELY